MPKDFSEWATSPRSAAVMDDTLSFESQILKDALQEWSKRAANSIPHRSNFSARDVKTFVGNLAIFERIENVGYRIRLLGTQVTNVLGEMQGQLIDDALPRDTAKRWKMVLDNTLSSVRPCRIISTVAFNHLEFLEAEIFMAPLLDDQHRPTMVLAVATFRSGLHPPHTVEGVVSAKHSVT
jgi:hypothetical protein